MRKGLILLSVFVLLVGVYGLGWAAGIRFSKHDFGTSDSTGSLQVGYGGDPTGQICRACHIPHKSLETSANLGDYWSRSLLWRQTLGARTGFFLWNYSSDYWYTGWRIDDTAISPKTYTDLDATSKGCLGCHDGQSFYLWPIVGTNIYSTVKITRAGAVKTDLRNDHPVGIKYDATFGVGNELRIKTEAEGLNIVFSNDGKLGCGSCHDPHNKASGSNFVRVSMSNSSLCLACHIK